MYSEVNCLYCKVEGILLCKSTSLQSPPSLNVLLKPSKSSLKKSRMLIKTTNMLKINETIVTIACEGVHVRATPSIPGCNAGKLERPPRGAER